LNVRFWPVAALRNKIARFAAGHSRSATVVSPFRFRNQCIPALAHQRVPTRQNVLPLAAAYCCISWSMRSRMT
jgi:hypothetical protein